MDFFQTLWAYANPVLCIIIEVVIALGMFAGLVYIYKTVSRHVGTSSDTWFSIEDKFIQVVRYFNQTLVDNWKSESGKLTTEQIEDVQNKAISMIESLLTCKEIEYLMNKYDSYNDAIKLLLENAVVTVKAEQNNN